MGGWGSPHLFTTPRLIAGENKGTSGCLRRMIEICISLNAQMEALGSRLPHRPPPSRCLIDKEAWGAST